jgi:hypothetical protein
MDAIRQTALDRFQAYLERRQFSAHTVDLLYVSAQLQRWQTLTGTVMIESGQLVAH